MSSNKLLRDLRDGKALSGTQQILMIIQLSIPAILSQISTVLMQYIDASMVGSLGAGASASIGLVASTTWLMGNIYNAAAIGFNVQIAQYIGAKRDSKARHIFRQGLFLVTLLALIQGLFGTWIHRALPAWLGGNPEILSDASSYFLIYALGIPVSALLALGNGALQSTGNMVVPGVLLVLMCALDVIFNFFCIFPARAAGSWTLPGLGLGVAGASLGTLLAQACTALVGFAYILFRTDLVKVHQHSARADMGLRSGMTDSVNNMSSAPHSRLPLLDWHDIRIALKIAIPVAIQGMILNGAQIISTRIVAPLGTVAIAANSLSVTAESLCYMPGHGIGTAGTTTIGQTIGAGRKDLVRRLGWLTVIFGSLVMTLSGLIMFIFAPAMIGFLTPDPDVRLLGAEVLRIEAFAEPLFGAAIVAEGVFRGAGDTFIPSCMSLLSMWAVRIPLAAFLAPRIGLRGVWIAMAIELSVRGILYLVRLGGRRWTRQVIR